jgi:uncharacterized protein YjiS (DUF1127 family)
MTMIETSFSMPGARVRVPEPLTHLWNLFGQVTIWRERHAWRADLCRLDDHLLADIGLTRAEAEVEIAKPFWRR